MTGELCAALEARAAWMSAPIADDSDSGHVAAAAAAAPLSYLDPLAPPWLAQPQPQLVPQGDAARPLVFSVPQGDAARPLVFSVPRAHAELVEDAIAALADDVASLHLPGGPAGRRAEALAAAAGVVAAAAPF